MSEETTNERPLTVQAPATRGGGRYADPSAISVRFSSVIEEVSESLGEITVAVKRVGVLDVLRYLRDEPQFAFNFLSDLSGVDLGEFAAPRFAVAYHLFSLTHGHRLRIKVFLEEDDARLPTASGIWRSADWMEREVFDLFGIDFTDHPDLRRILLPADYEGFPLRKDFPVKGF